MLEDKEVDKLYSPKSQKTTGSSESLTKVSFIKNKFLKYIISFCIIVLIASNVLSLIFAFLHNSLITFILDGNYFPFQTHRISIYIMIISQAGKLNNIYLSVAFVGLIFFILTNFNKDGDIILRLLYDEYFHAFIGLLVLTTAPYVVGMIIARNYYTILLVLIIEALNFSKE